MAGKCRILPGIDIGIPTGKNSRQASPDDTYAAVMAALKAAAQGVILSRKYSEMRLANLEAGGRAAGDDCAASASSRLRTGVAVSERQGG